MLLVPRTVSPSCMQLLLPSRAKLLRHALKPPEGLLHLSTAWEMTLRYCGIQGVNMYTPLVFSPRKVVMQLFIFEISRRSEDHST